MQLDLGQIGRALGHAVLEVDQLQDRHGLASHITAMAPFTAGFFNLAAKGGLKVVAAQSGRSPTMDLTLSRCAFPSGALVQTS